MQIRPERMEAYAEEALRLYHSGSYEDCISYSTDILLNLVYRVKNETDEAILGNIYYVLGNLLYGKRRFFQRRTEPENMQSPQYARKQSVL